jgi:hypothetical protein
MKIVKLICLVSFFLPSASIASKTAPIMINPVLSHFDSLPVIKDMLFYIDKVELSTTEKDPTLGETRTGRKTMAPVVCSPSLDTVLKQSFSHYLDAKKMSASDMSTAHYILSIEILNAELVETTRGLSQTMNATLKVNATFANPSDSSRVKSYVIESQSSKTTLDTTKSSEAVFRSVIEGVIKELMKSFSD